MNRRLTYFFSALLSLALLLFLLPAAARAEGNVEISEANFPDSVFRQYVKNKLDTDKDGSLSPEECAAAVKIYTSGKVSTLKGIEYFPNLKDLTCTDGTITEVDLSHNTALETVNLYGQELTSVDFSHNPALTLVKIDNNQLASIDVSGLSKLESLSVGENPLTEIDLKNNTLLKLFACQKSQISALDLSRNTQLTSLTVRNCPLTALDIRNNTELTGISLSDCQVTSLDVGNNPKLIEINCENNKLAKLDISKNELLERLFCAGNEITSLVFSNHPELWQVRCRDNLITELDVSGLPKLTYLYCENNRLTRLELGHQGYLDSLTCSNNELASLDLSRAYTLEYLYCSNNKLTELDVSKNTALMHLECGGNLLKQVDVSYNTGLVRLYCENNLLEGLDINNNTSLEKLHCYGNPFKVLDLRNVSNLRFTATEGTKTSTEEYDSYVYYKNELQVGKDVRLVVEGEGILIDGAHFPDPAFRTAVEAYDTDENGLLSDPEIAAVTALPLSEKGITSLKGLEYFTALSTLFCDENLLTELDVSKNTALSALYCDNNRLTSLDVTGNPELTVLGCSNNELRELDLRKNTLLTVLSVSGNKLETLDVSQSPELRGIDCSNNELTELKTGKCVNMISLNCDHNKLTSMDFSKMPMLLYLTCHANSISVLDLSKASMLKQAVLKGEKDASGEEYDEYTFNSGDGFVRLRADKDCILLPEGNPFLDVKEGKYYYVPVLWAFTRDPKITGGTDDTHFSPNMNCSRGQVVTFLWRSQGSPEPSGSENPFKDVKEGKFYYKAVLWAVENGITTGKTPTTFEPGGDCSRAEFVTFLWRTVGKPEPELAGTEFTDVKEGKFYYKPMLWAVENGITTGTSPTTFSPNDICPRGQVVTFLYRTFAGKK